MGKSISRKLSLLLSAAFLSTASGSWALNTASNTADFTKKVISKEREGYKTPSERLRPDGRPVGVLPGVPASPSKGRPSTGSEGNSAMGRRYWFTPDAVRILKVRGDSGEERIWRENQDGKTGRQVLPLLSWGNPRAPELAGWGSTHPYDAEKFKGEANYMYSEIGNSLSNRGGIVSRPFDAGLTRYEMWVKKSANPKSGWTSDAWFFNSYNVISQGGGVLGEISITTPDSLLGSTRTFRDAPYLIDVTEDSGIMRTFSPNSTSRQAVANASVLTNSVSLVSQPKMLVLLAPGNAAPGDDESTRAGSASATRVSQVNKPRTYVTTPAAGSPLPADLGRQLAPNVNINDAGPDESTLEEGSLSQNYKKTPLAKNWHYDQSSKKWHFRQWQRGEFTEDNQPHTWILETKEDLLYAPQTTATGIVDPNRVTILNPQETAVTSIPSTIVSSGQVQAFDTGGFRLAINDVMKKSEWGSGKGFSGLEGIPDLAAMNVVPVGYFYPDSRIIVALEYVLLKKVGSKWVEEGGWQTGKIHYWNSGDQSTSPLLAKEVTFDRAGGSFDPYVHGWIFPIKDVSHTSARYRLRVFMALPFTPVENPNGKLPSSFENNEKIASSFGGTTFGIDQMIALLAANSRQPARPSAPFSAKDPMQYDQDYRAALDQVNLSGNYGVAQDAVRQVSADEVERIVSGVTFSGASQSLNSANIGDVRSPFAPATTAWFEFVFDDASWTVDVPEIIVGLDPEEAGVIITE